MDKVNKVRVTVLGEQHDQAMLVGSIKAGRTISITAEELAEFNQAEVTSTELDNVFIAVLKRNEKYVPINGKKFLRKLLDQGVGTQDKPLHVKLLSSVQFKKSRFVEIEKLAEHFNTKPTNQKRQGDRSYNGARQYGRQNVQ